MKKEKRLPIISIHSYKGGVGKSTVAALLGVSAGKTRKTCLVDGDLMAPGLHFSLGLEPYPMGVMDYLIGDAEDPDKSPSAREVCYKCEPDFEDLADCSLRIVPGHPGFDKALDAQSYILADSRSGLVQARLEFMLYELIQQYGFELFIIDSPPSLFGMSAVIRSLADRHQGTQIFVSTPNNQDLSGSWEMLNAIEREQRALARRAGGETLIQSRQALILNRCKADWDITDDRRVVRRTFELALGKEGENHSGALIDEWLNNFDVTCVMENNAFERMTPPFVGEPKPRFEELLDRKLEGFMDIILRRAKGN